MDSKEVRGLMEAYAQVHIPQEVSEAYQEPKFARKDYLNKLSKRGGMGMGTPTDPHGYRDPKMAKVGSEFSKRKTAAAKAKKTGTPDSYRAEKESQSKLRKEEVDIFDVVLEFLCVEGYAETLEEAEWMMANELTPEDIEEILEAHKEPNLQKMRNQENRHMKKAIGYGGSRGSKNRANKMSSIRGALERGEDPRADGYGGARAARGNSPVDHRAAYSKNPLNNPPRRVKKPGV